MNFLCIDIGTTCCKYQLFDNSGKILGYKSQEVPLKTTDDGNFVDIYEIVATVKSLIKDSNRYGSADSVAFSSLGESFVLLDKNDEILTLPMLYTDIRGEKQAKDASLKIGADKIFEITGVYPHAMYSIYKLLWIKENWSSIYKKTDKLMLIGEYVGYLLTGQRIIDYALASRTGVFDVHKKTFSSLLLEKLDIPERLFSKPQITGTLVGKIKESVANELGLNKECALVLGSHDQVCATLGAGVFNAGESADGMGTVECITCVYDELPTNAEFGKSGYPIVPFFDKYCTYILNFSCGSLVNWYKKGIAHDFCGNETDFFTYIESQMTKQPTDLFILPYFSGAATPYEDGNAKGAILNLTLNTKDSDIYKAILESTGYEMKVNIEYIAKFGIDVKKLVATGGGAKSTKWLQIKSNILNKEIKQLNSSEGGLCGLAIMQAVALKTALNYNDAIKTFVKYKNVFLPSDETSKIYLSKFESYKKIYKTLKEFN